ncbi:flagellar hook capping FlgD N-terminal domain-containing protein [Desulforudis sp. 1088]|uniref:flagellar hook capping FlgD N-terminal domain-containing protein n=1 Tax=unclassified Candidatus Desulforudis TaxID=2635950 RepID=UPI003CE55482
MAVDAIGGVTQAQPKAAPRNTFDKDTFLKVLVAQLQHPDPFAPQDMTSQIGQMVQFGMLERLFAVEQALEQMGKATRVREALDLLGKEVVLKTESGEITGTVRKVTFNEEGPLIVVGGESYLLAQVAEIKVPGTQEPAAETSVAETQAV